jgi:galactose-1-phosphate uridylyltransferase
MAGYELVCEPQRDLTAEKAAAALKKLPDKHYTVTSDVSTAP